MVVIYIFGDKLKELRKRKNLKQEDIANLVNVGYTSVSNWENNVSEPSYDIVKTLANFFGVSTDYLLGVKPDDKDKIEKLKDALREYGIDDYDKAIKLLSLFMEDQEKPEETK